MEVEVQIDDKAVRRKIAKITSTQMRRRLVEHVGGVVLEQTKDFLDEMAAGDDGVNRHKVADRLGAPHSKYLEYASGRVAGSPRQQNTVLEDVGENGATIAIKNTPGLSRAYHDLHITPKRVGALTIPIDRISAHKGVRDLRKEGHEIFRPKGTNILAETRGKGKNAKLRPLFALVKSVTVPQDRGLLPTANKIREWTTDAADEFLEIAGG